MHLIIDGYSSDQKVLRDEDFLRKWLETYPARIGMTRISLPYVLKYMGPVLEDWGISGFVYINIDIFSCKDFNTEKAIEDFRGGFHLVKWRTCLIDREWPKAESTMTNPQSFIYHE
jgi:S-adenosylmethionine decarboxylase